MIDPEAITTYAQYNEDIILLALLHDVKKGFYVDVGANYPTTDSVTKLFYDQGWNGINIEPIKSLHKELKKKRPRDINIQSGIGAKSGLAKFREYPTASGHSTFDNKQKAAQDKSLKYKEYDVPIKTLEEIFVENEVSHVDFLKVDVEGFEHEVIAGNNWKKYRPDVLCIEANHVSQDWKKILTNNKYRLFISDGLNEYYVEEGTWKITEDFVERVVKLDYHALKQHQYQSWAQDSKDQEKLHKMVADQQASIDSLTSSVRRLEAQSGLSLRGHSYPNRLKRAAYGLTIDWLRFKQKKTK